MKNKIIPGTKYIFCYNKLSTRIFITEHNCERLGQPDICFQPRPRRGVTGEVLVRL